MTKTQNYNLNKPEATDPLRLADFNGNADIIDGALAALGGDHVYVGSYVSDGTKSRTIQLPWAPKFVLVLGHQGDSNTPIFLVDGQTLYHYANSWANGINSLKLVGDTLVISSNTLNIKDKVETYILFR